MRTFKFSYGLNYSGRKSFPVQVIIGLGGIKIHDKYPRLIFPLGFSVEKAEWDKKKGLPIDSKMVYKLLSLSERLKIELNKYEKMSDLNIIQSIPEIKRIINRAIQSELPNTRKFEKERELIYALIPPTIEYASINRINQFDLRVIDRSGREIDIIKLFNWKYQDISDLYVLGKFELNGKNKEDKYPILLWKYIIQVAEYKKKQIKKPLTNDAEYKKLSNKMKNYSDELTLGQYNDYIGQDFLNFVKENYEITSLNSFGSVIKTLHAVLNYAISKDKQTLLTGEKFVLDNVDLHDEMYDKQKESVDNVYLTEENLKHLASVKKLTNTQEYVRDLFIVGSYTAVRFGDLKQTFNINEIKHGIFGISYKDEKTGIDGVIPIPKFVHEIIRSYNYYFDPITSKTFNSVIKDVCKIAGMTANYSYSKTNVKTGKIEVTTEPFFKMVASHSMKRSFATNMYIHNKLPKRLVMYFTHHTKEDTFDDYIKVKAHYYIDEYIDKFINKQ